MTALETYSMMFLSGRHVCWLCLFCFDKVIALAVYYYDTDNVDVIVSYRNIHESECDVPCITIKYASEEHEKNEDIKGA